MNDEMKAGIVRALEMKEELSRLRAHITTLQQALDWLATNPSTREAACLWADLAPDELKSVFMKYKE